MSDKTRLYGSRKSGVFNGTPPSSASLDRVVVLVLVSDSEAFLLSSVSILSRLNNVLVLLGAVTTTTQSLDANLF